jgi:general secretion pathway protein D
MPPPISASVPTDGAALRPSGGVPINPGAGRNAVTAPELFVGAPDDARQTAPAPLTPPGMAEPPVRLNFSDAGLAEVVDVILGQTLGINYTIDPAVSGSVTLRSTRPIPRDALLAVLDNILALNGAMMVPGRDLYSIVPLDSTLGAPGAVVDRERIGYQPGRALYVVPVTNASAESLLELVQSVVGEARRVVAEPLRNLLLVVGTDRDARAVEEIVSALDVDAMAGRSFGILPVENAGVLEVTAELQEVFAGDGSIRFLPVERMNAVLAIANAPGAVTRARDWVRRLDRSDVAGGLGMQVNVYYVRNGDSVELASVLAQLFGGEARSATPGGEAGGVAPTLQSASLRRPAGGAAGTLADAAADFTGDGAEGATPSAFGAGPAVFSGAAAAADGDPPPRFIADERNNSIVIVSTPEQYRLAQATLARLDLQPLQVLIEATIAEVTLNDDLRYGLQWFFNSGNFSTNLSTNEGGGIGNVFPGFNLLYSTTDARVVLNALAEVTDVKVVSSPQLMVLDNRPARLQVGDQVPVTTQQAVSVDNPDAPIVNSVQLVDTGVILEVTPKVRSSGLVTLDVLQEISDAIRSDADDTLPTIQQRRIQTSVAVSDGETVALAGLIRERAEEGQSGVPVLMDIPYLGNLFKTTNRVSARTEILVLITPRVMRSTSEARQVADELRARLEQLGTITRPN